jgi:hypothetical protein
MLVILAGQRGLAGHQRSVLVHAVAAVCCCRMTLKRQDY